MTVVFPGVEAFRHAHGQLTTGVGERVADPGWWSGLRSLMRVRMIQQSFRSDVSIGLLRDRIGRQPRPLPCPERDFAFALGWLQVVGGPTQCRAGTTPA